MVNILNPYDIVLSEFQEKLRFIEKSPASVLLSKNNIDPDRLNAITEILDSEKLLWVSSSGTFNKKLIGLSSKALLNSANSVNEWLDVSTLDSWAIALPLQHIASVAILYRSILSESKVKLFNSSWSAESFCNFLEENKTTLCSLVPTQLYDIVSKKLRPAPKLRAVLVGGAKLDQVVYMRARKLGWPVLPTYGLTECASQVACATLDSLDSKNQSPELVVMPHLEVESAADQRLIISGSSLLTKSIIFESSGVARITDYSQEKFFISNDLGTVNDRVISLSGRTDRCVEVRGSFVQLQSYDELAYKFFNTRFPQSSPALITTTINDLRDGFKIALCISGFKSELSKEQLMQEFNNFIAQNNPDLILIEYVLELQGLPVLDNHKINYTEVEKIAAQIISDG